MRCACINITVNWLLLIFQLLALGFVAEQNYKNKEWSFEEKNFQYTQIVTFCLSSFLSIHLLLSFINTFFFFDQNFTNDKIIEIMLVFPKKFIQYFVKPCWNLYILSNGYLLSLVFTQDISRVGYNTSIILLIICATNILWFLFVCLLYYRKERDIIHVPSRLTTPESPVTFQNLFPETEEIPIEEVEIPID